MKTWEMYKIALENPEARFKRLRDGAICYVGKAPKVIFKEPGISTHVNIDDEWELSRKAVCFMTAINSGKRIKPNVEGGSDFKESTYWLDGRIGTFQINGSWIIE